MQGSPRTFIALLVAATLVTACGRKKQDSGHTEAAAGKSATATSDANAGRSQTDSITGANAQSKGSGPGAAQASANPNGVPAEFAKSDEVYEAWFRKYKLDLTDPNMLDADPDGDGVSNRDEFMADTNPLDKNSHPVRSAADAEAHTGLRLKQYNEVRLPVILESVDGETAKIKRLDAGDKIETIRTGQTIAGLGLKVEKVQSRRITDKHGTPVDASRVTLEDPNTQEQTVIVKDMPARSGSTYAVLSSDDGKTSITVRQGDTFTWPQGGGASYKVIDLRADQAVLQEEGSGKMWTVMKQ